MPVAPLKNVVVLGASYSGARAAELLAKTLPDTHRVVLIDRQSHFNHLYIFPRLGVVPDHAHKAFIPLDKVFSKATPQPVELPSSTPEAVTKALATPASSHTALLLHAGVVSIDENYITIDRDLTGDEKCAAVEDLVETLERVGLGEADHGQRCVPYDFLVYALGCNLPPPLASPARNKAKGVEFLKAQQALIEKSSSILIAGGGALGIQYATDIADLYNNPEHAEHRPASYTSSTPKKITIVHSRDRFLPLYQDGMDDEVKRRMKELGVNVVMGERLALPSDEELVEQEKSGKMSKVVTSTGEEIEFDLLMRCTGQKPNSQLLGDFLPQSLDSHGFINVLPTLQVALPPSLDSCTNVFAIGDVAATGSIKAGHTGWNQAGIVAENICHLLGAPYADRTFTGAPDAEGKLVDKLVEYTPGPPQIKVTLGLSHSCSELLQDGPDTIVTPSTGGPVDGHWRVVWERMGADPENPMA
ncbi:hypothetical protein MNV49_000143 [Pseudohyphozyma bogoriensis]|nr:hypothetical protein MNV49_000143 [Pseudohyphozyma bogoriensis]